MLLLLGELAQALGHRERLVELAELDERLHEVGRDRERRRARPRPRGARAPRRRRRLSAAPRRVVREQGGDSACPQRLEPVPADAGRLGGGERLAPPSAPPRPAGRGPAASSARQRSYIGQIAAPARTDSAHSSSMRAAASQSPARSSSSHRCRRWSAYEIGSPRSSASESSSRQQSRAPGSTLAAPDEPLARHALRREGDYGGARRAGAEALAEVVDRASARGCAPTRARRARAARPPARRARRRQRLQRPRLRLADPLDADDGLVLAISGSTEARSAGSLPALGQRAVEVALDVVVAARRRRRSGAGTRAHAPRPGAASRARGRAARSRRCRSPASDQVARPSGEQPVAPLVRLRRRQAQRVLGRARPPPAARRARRRRRRPPRPSPRARRRAAPSRARGGARAARSSATTPASSRWSSRRSRARALSSPRRRAAGATAARGRRRRRARPASTASSRAVAAADRRELRRTQVGAERDGEQQPAHGGWEPRRRACRAGPRPRPGTGISSPVAAAPRSASVRPSSSANSGLPSVASKIRRSSGRREVRPSRSDSRRRVAPRLSGPRSSRSGPGSSACSRTDGVSGALGEQEGDRRVLEAARGEGERLGRRRIEPLDVVDREERAAREAASARSAFRQAERDRVRLGRRPVGSARSSATSSARSCGAGSAGERRAVDVVEEVGERRAKESCASASLGRAVSTRRPRSRASAIAGLPQRRLADPRPAGEHERAEVGAAQERVEQRRAPARGRRRPWVQALWLRLPPSPRVTSRPFLPRRG